MNNQVQMNNHTQNAPKVQGEEKLKDVLDTLVERGQSNFPKGIHANRLKANALMYIAQDANLTEAARKTPSKVAQIVYNFIALGLDMLNRECYIIPFVKNRDRPNEFVELTIIKDYKGEIKLARKYSVDPIREIFARVVYEKDKYHFNELGHFVHVFDPFDVDRGARKGAYCTVVYENGVQQTEFVNVEEINKIKSVSKSASYPNSPWNQWEDEMWRKTAIRKAMKNISLDFGSSEIQEINRGLENDVDFDNGTQASTHQQIKAQNDAFENVVESEAKEVNFNDI